MAPYHTPPLQRPRRCVVFSLVVAAVCSLGHGAGGNTVNMGPAVGHAEATQPGDALAPAPAPTPAADPNAPLSNRVAMMVCYQFIVKALMATDSKEEPEVADCLVQIHELWDKDVKDADGLVDDSHCRNFVAASAQTTNLRVLLGQVAAAKDATLQRVFAPVREGGTALAPRSFACPILVPEKKRTLLVGRGLFTVKELFVFVGTACAGLLVLGAGTLVTGNAPRGKGVAAAITTASKPSRAGRIPVAAALMSCLAPVRS